MSRNLSPSESGWTLGIISISVTEVSLAYDRKARVKVSLQGRLLSGRWRQIEPETEFHVWLVPRMGFIVEGGLIDLLGMVGLLESSDFGDLLNADVLTSQLS